MKHVIFRYTNNKKNSYLSTNSFFSILIIFIYEFLFLLCLYSIRYLFFIVRARKTTVCAFYVLAEFTAIHPYALNTFNLMLRDNSSTVF